MAVVALKPKPRQPSFGEALTQTAKAEPKAKKKSSMPTLEATPEVKQAVDDYQEAKTTYKMAEATMDSTAQVLMEFVRQQQDQDGFAGRYQGSYAVMGVKHQAKVVFANKFSLNPEDEPQLAELLGDEFDNLIQKKFNVKLKEQVFTDEGLQAELMELVGERFADFFETTVSLGVCEDFSRLVYRVLEPGRMDDFRTYARQYKPSIR